MMMDTAETLAPPAHAAANATPTEVFLQVGALTRLLHDTLAQLGVMPKLQIATDGLPDARSRLNYIAEKTAAAADKVLDSVDKAKAEQDTIASETRRLASILTEDPVKAIASGAVWNFVSDVEARTARVDAHLTDIMMAQDFHDLTGQVINRITQVAQSLEDQLVQLLVDATPPEKRNEVEEGFLNGPVISAEGRSDVVTSQTQVDDLLESLGF